MPFLRSAKVLVEVSRTDEIIELSVILLVPHKLASPAHRNQVLGSILRCRQAFLLSRCLVLICGGEAKGLGVHSLFEGAVCRPLADFEVCCHRAKLAGRFIRHRGLQRHDVVFWEGFEAAGPTAQHSRLSENACRAAGDSDVGSQEHG